MQSLTISLMSFCRDIQIMSQRHNASSSDHPKRKIVVEDNDSKSSQTILPDGSVVKSTPYQKKYSLQVFPLEPLDIQLELRDIILKYLSQGQHLISMAPNRRKEYFEQILKETASVQFTHHLSNKSLHEYAFSKFQILKIVTIQEWKREMIYFHKPKRLNDQNYTSIENTWYNYFDYVRAQEQVFFYQNSKLKHSWFLSFASSFSSVFPSWFHNWWDIFEATEAILPPPLIPFHTHYQAKISFVTTPMVTAYMFVSHNLSQILKLEYKIDSVSIPPCLERQIFQKWWDKFNIGLIQTSKVILPSSLKPPSTQSPKQPSPQASSSSPAKPASSKGKGPASLQTQPPSPPTGANAHSFFISHSIPRTSKNVPLHPLPIPFYPYFADQLKAGILCKDPSYVDQVIQKVLKELHSSQLSPTQPSISHSSSLSPLGTVFLNNANDDFFTQPGSNTNEASSSPGSPASLRSMLQGRDTEDR